MTEDTNKINAISLDGQLMLGPEQAKELRLILDNILPLSGADSAICSPEDLPKGWFLSHWELKEVQEGGVLPLSLQPVKP